MKSSTSSFDVLVTDAGRHGQLLDAGEFSLQKRRGVLGARLRHPAAAGANQRLPGLVDQHVEAINQIQRQPGELVLRQRDLHADLFGVVLRLVDQVGTERRILEGRDRRRLGAVRRFEILAEGLRAQAVAEKGVVGVGQRDVRDFVARAFADDVSLDRAARDSGGDIARHGDPVVVALDVVAIERQLDTLILPSHSRS